jgi:hypothetical protein
VRWGPLWWSRGLGQIDLPCGWWIRLASTRARGPDIELGSGGLLAGPVIGRIWRATIQGPAERYGSVEIELHGRQS